MNTLIHTRHTLLTFGTGVTGKGPNGRIYSFYQTSFEIPSEWPITDRILLSFGAVDYEATIFVNGHKAGLNTGGYFEFTVDVTPYLVANGENELYVSLDPFFSSTAVLMRTELFMYTIPRTWVSAPSATRYDHRERILTHMVDRVQVPIGKQTLGRGGMIWYTPCSGIWQTVWLESAPTEHVAKLDLVADMNGKGSQKQPTWLQWLTIYSQHYCTQ
jgi:hypothetical protein